jgi:hypothetical protein
LLCSSIDLPKHFATGILEQIFLQLVFSHLSLSSSISCEFFRQFFEISNERRIVIHVPSGFAHGFLALEDETLVCYAQDFEYDKKLEYAINAFDPQINILWPLGIDFLQSKKDSEAQSLSEFGDQFPNRFQ